MSIDERKKDAEIFERELFRLVEEKYRAKNMKPTHFGRAVWGGSGPRALRLLQMLLPENNPDGSARKRSVSLVDVFLMCGVLGVEPSRLFWETEQRVKEVGVVKSQDPTASESLKYLSEKMGVDSGDLELLIKLIRVE